MQKKKAVKMTLTQKMLDEIIPPIQSKEEEIFV